MKGSMILGVYISLCSPLPYRYSIYPLSSSILPIVVFPCFCARADIDLNSAELPPEPPDYSRLTRTVFPSVMLIQIDLGERT